MGVERDIQGLYRDIAPRIQKRMEYDMETGVTHGTSQTPKPQDLTRSSSKYKP